MYNKIIIGVILTLIISLIIWFYLQPFIKYQFIVAIVFLLIILFLLLKFPFKRNWIYLGIFIIFVLHFLFLRFLYLLFPYNFTYKNITVYTFQPIDYNINNILLKVDQRLQKSEFYNNKKEFKILISNSYNTMGLLTFGLNFLQGINLDFPYGYIAITKVDIKNNKVIRLGEQSSRSLVSLLSHEITHSYINNNSLFIPLWKIEGYCDYISEESDINENEGKLALISGKIDQKFNKYWVVYFKGFLRNKYLIEGEGLTYKEIIKNYYDEKELDKKVINRIQKNI